MSERFRLWYSVSDSTSSGVDWEELDLAAYHFDLESLKRSYSGPAELRFTLSAPSHTRPIDHRALVILVDTEYNPSIAFPIFEGHVWNIEPNGPLEINYTCYDQTMRARNEITIMSGPHGDSNVIPRLVYNSKIDNDDDRAFEFRHNATVSRIIQDILTFAYNELVSVVQAAPPVTIGGDAYVSADLAALDFVPQEKMTFESELLGQGLDRLLNYYPQYRMIFVPGQHSFGRKWRFLNVKNSPKITFTLNEFDSGEKHVLSMSISPSLEQRFTAVKIYGPLQQVMHRVYQEEFQEGLDASGNSVIYPGGGLIKGWTLQQEINFQEFGPASRPASVGNAGRVWQIADEDKRKIARIMPEEAVISSSEFNVAGTNLLFKRTRRPTFQVWWDHIGQWWTVNGVHLDVLTGIITAPYHLWQGVDLGSGSGSSAGGPGSFSAGFIGQYRVPDNARFIYAYFGDPIVVRYPASGYQGSAYSIANVQTERKSYDEMFAIGYESGFVVTTADRTAQYQKLAQQIHESTKDMVFTGGCTLDGIDYAFLYLNYLVNFTSVNPDGSPLTTGWEEIDAILTDVEYDYRNDLTTLTFSSDHMEFTQQDPEQLKARLKIRAQRIETIVHHNVSVGNRGRLNTYKKLIVEQNDLGQDQVVGEL